MPKDRNTEVRILAAAKDIFFQKGLAGARMHEIAEAAQINKAMLNYYFTSKQALFERVFKEAFMLLVPGITHILGSDQAIADKIRAVVAFYHERLIEMPHMPVFVLNAIQSDPSIVVRTFEENPAGIQQVMMKLIMQMQVEVQAGRMRPIDPRDLLLNVVSMSVFPFMMKPMIGSILQMGEKEFQDFVGRRKKVVADFVLERLMVAEQANISEETS